MKIKTVFACMIAVNLAMFADESVTSERILEKDTSVVIGQLENGLTYYIKSNQFPKNQAVIQLAVKAGSLHEEEHQRGLAHFLEHMLFRGSENFKDWEVIKYLESIGAQFGADTNAYTTQDMTVYHFNVPSDKEEIVEQGLFILSEYAGKATLSPELVEKEREVVMDEYNIHHRSAQGRMGDDLFGQVLAGSRYAERMPIGLEGVIRGCDPQAIRDFYEKWYRPNRMAVIVVGDLDTEKVQALVERYFGYLQNPSDEPEEPDHTLPLSERKAIVAGDEEATNTEAGIYLISEKEGGEVITASDVKEGYFARFFLTALSERLDRLATKNPAPFSYHGEHTFDITAFHEMDLAFFIGFEGRELEGLKAYLEEIKSIKEHGLTEKEFERCRTSILESFKTNKAQVDRTAHFKFVSDYIAHFMNKRPFFDPLSAIQFDEEVLSTITVEDVGSWIKESIDLSSFGAFYAGPNAKTIDKDALLQVIQEVEGNVAKPLEASQHVEFFTPVGTDEDRTYQFVSNEEFGFKTMTLSNGMRVVIHPSGLEKESVTISAIAKGGVGLFSSEELASVGKIPSYIDACGLANFDKMDFQNLMQEKNLSFFVNIGLNTRCLVTSGRSENIGLMLQVLRSTFCSQRFDSNAWENLYSRDVEFEKGAKNDPYRLFSIELAEILYSGHPFYAYHSSEEATEVGCQKAIHRLFSDPSEFTLVIVGDVQLDAVEKLVSEWMSFPKQSTEESILTYAPRATYPNESKEVLIHKGKDTHCLNYIFQGGDFNFEHKKDFGYTMQAFNHAITFRLLENLRKKMGETYGASAGAYFPLSPDQDEVLFMVSFTAEHKNAAGLAKIAEEEVQRFLSEGISEEEIQVAKEILVQQHNQELQSNRVLSGNHVGSALYDKPFDYFMDFSGNLERQVTKERVDAFAKAVLGQHPTIKIRMMPEKAE